VVACEDSCGFASLRAGNRLPDSDRTSPMLALTRSTRAAHALSFHARALSTIAQSTGSPSTYAQQNGNDYAPAETGAEIRQTRLASSRPVCMLVYPWNSIRSSAEGLAIARAVQDKYGPAKEIIFSRVCSAQLASVIRHVADAPPCRTTIVSTYSSHTFGSYMMTRTWASASQRIMRRSRYTSQTCLGAMAMSASKK
jgi:hypothetical protein